MLKVSQFKKKVRHTTEASFERAVADKLGTYSRHMSDAQPGLPDRYVIGGKWIEFKSIAFKRDVSFGAGLSNDQRREMSRLSDAGDDVYWCALVQHEDGEKFIICVDWRQRDRMDGYRYDLAALRERAYRYPIQTQKMIKEVIWKS